MHEGRLLSVCPGHEISHVAGYCPRLSTEVGLFINHHLHIKDYCKYQNFQRCFTFETMLFMN